MGVVWLIAKLVRGKDDKRSLALVIGTPVVGALMVASGLLATFPEIEIPIQFLGLLPYILTILVLAGVVGRAVAPAAIGKAYEKQ